MATRREWKLWGAAIGALALAGCSSGQTVAPTTLTGPTTTATTVPPSTTTSTATAPLPTLGEPAGIFAHGKGFGQVKPSTIYNGGDPTGLVQHVVWKSWGGPKAVATGESDYVGPNQEVAQGTEELATVVAFKLGTCDGKLMYQAVEWYFPQHGQTFHGNEYENICSGTYVTSATTASTCLPAQVTARQGHQVGGATGERAMLITLTNNGPVPCVLDGYLQVRFLTSTGVVLNLPQVRHSQYVTASGPRPVTLGIGTTAYVLVAQYRCDLGYLHQSAGARLTLPAAAAGTALRVRTDAIPLPLAYCKGGATSPGNVIAVTPVESTLAATVP